MKVEVVVSFGSVILSSFLVSVRSLVRIFWFGLVAILIFVSKSFHHVSGFFGG